MDDPTKKLGLSVEHRRVVPMGLGIVTAATGLIVLYGWSINSKVLRSAYPDFDSMSPLAAICFILIGAGLAFLSVGRNRSLVLSGRIFASLAGLFSVAVFAEYLFAIDLGIDNMLFSETVATDRAALPGRPAAESAVGILFLSLSLLSLRSSSTSWSKAGQWLALFALLISVVGSILFIYGVPRFDPIPGSTYMSFTTAFAMFVTSLGVLVAGGPTGPFKVFWSDGAGGILARRLFPFILLMPILVGWLRHRGQLEGLYSLEYGIAIVTLASIVGFAVMTLWIAASIDKFESARKTAELAIAQKALMIQQSFEPMFVWDLDGGIIEWNPGCERLYGYNQNEALGTRGHDLLRSKYPMPSEDLFTLLRNERWWSGEIIQTLKDGSLVISESRLQVVDDGERTLVLQTERDISERKAFEEKLVAARDFNKDALNAMPGIVYLFNTNGKFLGWNDNFEQVSEYSHDEIAQMHPTDFFRSNEVDEISARIGETFEKGESSTTANFLSKSGVATPYYFTGKRVVLNGELCLIGMGIDVTERLLADQKLRESEQRYRFLFEKNPFPMWVYDVETLDFVAVNPAAVAKYGYTEEEFLAMDITVIRPEESVPALLDNVNERHPESDNAGIWIHRRKDGTLMEMEIIRDELILAGRHCRLVLAQDVTKHNQAIEALRESEARYKLLFENNPYPMWVYDLDTLQFLAVNRAAISSYGYSEDEFLSMSITDIRPPQEVPKLLRNIDDTVGGLSKSESWQHLKKDKSVIEVDITSYTLDFDGHNSRLVLANDVTQRNEAIRRLHESEVLFRSVFNLQFQFLAILTPDGRVREINELPLRVTRAGREEFIGQQFWKTPPWRDLPGFDKFWQDRLDLAAETDEPLVVDDIYQTSDGTIRTAECSVSVVRDSEGEIDFYVVQASDTTEKKEAEENLRRSEEQFRTMFEIASVGIVQIDAQSGKPLVFNEKYAEITGHSFDELREMQVFELNHPEDREADLKLYWDAAHGRIPQYISEKRYVRKDGSHIWVRVNATFFRNPNGVASKTMAIVEDITQRKNAERDLLSMNAELERRVADRTVELNAVNKELGAFAYSVSHDLRAPLRAMDGFSQALLEDYSEAIDDTGKDYLGRIRSASQRMEGLIEDLLKLSRVTRSEINRQHVNISELARAVVEELRLTEPERKVKVTIAEGIKLDCDEKLARIALQNLIGNAWKFSSKRDDAEIEVGVSRSDPAEVFVRDNGAGFDMSYADKLFGAFQRLHRADEFEGTGIGLATVQRIVHIHGGQIRAESKPDEGATFFFTLR